MKKETRTVVYDDELRLEAYRFEGLVQPFPNHFHEYYVIPVPSFATHSHKSTNPFGATLGSAFLIFFPARIKNM